ncbi:MAG: wax ester/triacylglycerol synthase family O-acyltransferase [Streptosporangiaceae bacterium]
MKSLGTLDAGFFFAEDSDAPLHIGSVTVFEGPVPSYGDLVRMILARLPLLPRYRQRVRTVPFSRPVWVDDQNFQVLYHVRHTAVPGPGGAEELRNLAGRVFAQRLDLARPPWELWMVEGLEDDRWALIAKVHHCVVDGVGGSDLMTTLFDVCRESSFAGEAEPWSSRTAPGVLSLTLRGLVQNAAAPVRWLAHPALPRLSVVRGAWDFGAGLQRSLRRVAHRSVPSLTGPTGPHRRWSWTTLQLDQVKAVRQEYGTTVNDVIVAVVTSGFRSLLAGRGELEPTSHVRSLIPVSVRGENEHDLMANRISALVIDLPCGQADPVARLAALHAQMDDLKQTHQAATAQALTELAGSAPFLLSLASRTTMSVARPLCQTVITNVPGPPIPLYVLGRQAVELYPYVPIAAGAGISVGVFSYLGVLYFGITGDFDTVPDLEVLTKGIDHGLSELLAAA